jgi:hypothetical protein
MKNASPHSFHIPVMGLGFTIDTPLKVGRFGISSTLSIIEDNLIEQMREFYCRKNNLLYEPILKDERDYRARRITDYLDLLDTLLNKQLDRLKSEPFTGTNEIDKYFLMLENSSFLKLLYITMIQTSPGSERKALEGELRRRITPGSIDVNIMTKCDRAVPNTQENAALSSDALSALRGFANSKLQSSIVFSAGLNPRLFSYCETFNDFYPANGNLPKKKIIIKVSDYRSALIQGKFLAKKGLLVSEFRIESGLNCGGHAFPTEGLLLGPILEEFKNKRSELSLELLKMCNEALKAKGKSIYTSIPSLLVTVQGGIGTAAENKFLREYFKVDATGWGSPFLLVPEATNVDEETLHALASASPTDYYLSHASPLGIAFNNFRKSSSERQRLLRIQKKRPGSPCYKKFLAFNTEFTEEPICLASRQYQDLKIGQLKTSGLPEEVLKQEIENVMEKDCLCEGLAIAPIIKNDILKPKQLKAVAICPGPNLQYFSGTFTLQQMVDHIYGRLNLLNKQPRANLFINELRMYLDFLEKEISGREKNLANQKYIQSFKNALQEGIAYYRKLFPLFTEAFEFSMDALDNLDKNLSVHCSEEIMPA